MSRKDSFEGQHKKGESFQLIPLLREDSWELVAGSVVIDTKLGHGAFGDVYQGIVKKGRGREKDESDGIDTKNVAIKVLKGLLIANFNLLTSIL